LDCGNVRVASGEGSQQVGRKVAQFGGRSAVFGKQDKPALPEGGHRGRGRKLGGQHRPNMLLKGDQPSNLPGQRLHVAHSVEQVADSGRGH
jgi:hypothetical protein